MKSEKLIEIKKAKRVIFVGDTHGDLEASQKVIKNYLKPGNKIIFLGDYVDRGPFSKENLDFLLKTKAKNFTPYRNEVSGAGPNQIYLLQGNHEGHRILKFYPAEFWENLNKTDYKKYCSIVEEFPLAAVTDNIIALHGALPDVKDLEDINKIELGSKKWQQITWGDFYEGDGDYLGIEFQNPFTGRPQFGKDYFLKTMKRFNKKVLIRSHQPDAPQFMFNDRCLTIFTSSAYTRERTIAIADLKKTIKTAKDLEIKRI